MIPITRQLLRGKCHGTELLRRAPFSSGKVRLLHASYRSRARDEHEDRKLPTSKQDAQDQPSTTPPRIRYQRVTYEIPNPPKATPHIIFPNFPNQSTWRRYLPVFAGVGALVWAIYAYNKFITPKGGNESDTLNSKTFSTYIIVNKVSVCDDMMLIELAPTFEQTKKLQSSKKSFWNGKRIWSVEVKQPELQIVRNYTPLPLTLMGGPDLDRGVLKIINSANDTGNMMLVVKKYNEGEVSRWLHSLATGSRIEIRGPHVDYDFPLCPLDKLPPRRQMQDLPLSMPADRPIPLQVAKTIAAKGGNPHPEDLVFFAAGTGVIPILQVLLSRNPFRGNVDVFYSVRYSNEIPLPRIMYFLEKVGRANFHYFVEEDGINLKLEDVYPPSRDTSNSNILVTDQDKQEEETANKYSTALEQATALRNMGVKPHPRLALVCGPYGYISYVAGPMASPEQVLHDPSHDNQGQLGGLLAAKGWSKDEVYKMA